MSVIRLILRLSAIFLILSVVTGCQKPLKELVIGVLYDGNTDGGQSLRMSALLATEEINKKGGLSVNGRRLKVTLKFENTQGTQENTLRAAMRLLEFMPKLVVGPNSSQQMSAIVDLFEQNKVPIISPTASLPSLSENRKYVFRTVGSDEQQAKILAQFVARQLKTKKVAVFYKANNAYSRNLAASFQSDFNKLTGLDCEQITYVSGENKYQKQILWLKRNVPEVLLLPNDYEEVISQMIRIRAAGIQSIFIGGDSWHPAIFTGIPQAQGSYFVHHWVNDKETSNIQEQHFVEGFKTKYRLSPTIVSALSYDAFQLAFAAIGRSKGDSKTIRYQLSATDHFEGVTGKLSFNGKGIPEKSMNMYKLVHGEITNVDFKSKRERNDNR